MQNQRAAGSGAQFQRVRIPRELAPAPNAQKQKCTPQNGMSALPPKADMCGATRDVCFGPKADIATYSITSSPRLSSDSGTARPSILAVLRLITNSNFVGRSIGSAAG